MLAESTLKKTVIGCILMVLAFGCKKESSDDPEPIETDPDRPSPELVLMLKPFVVIAWMKRVLLPAAGAKCLKKILMGTFRNGGY